MLISKAEESRISIDIKIPSDMPIVTGDRDKLKQVIMNLVSNAIKYNRPGGKVIIGAGVDEKSWHFSISDTGYGIPEEAIPNLFQKFYRVKGLETKATGTGLGLSICKQIVQGHGGRIEVRSKVGEGTAFIVHIPK